MNGGLVPPVLLSVTIGLMLGFVQGRRAWLALAAFAVAALLGWVLPQGLSPRLIFTALWLSAIVAAVLVYLPVARWSTAVVLLCANAGYWFGACAALTGNRAALALVLLPSFVMLAAKWFTERKFDIVIKVAASWMIAIASLSLFVSLIPTPGYEPDHME